MHCNLSRKIIVQTEIFSQRNEINRTIEINLFVNKTLILVYLLKWSMPVIRA